MRKLFLATCMALLTSFSHVNAGFLTFNFNEHTDIKLKYDANSNELEVEVEFHDRVPEEEYETDEVLFIGLPPHTLTTRPMNSAFDFIGVSAGEVYHRLPQVVNPNLPFVGFAADEDNTGMFNTFVSSSVGLSVSAVRGPGDFSVWQTDASGPIVFFSSFSPVSASGLIPTPPGTHVHYNMGFSLPGMYEVDVTPVATRIPGQGIAPLSGTYTLFFQVGVVTPVPPAFVIAGLGIGCLALVRRLRSH